MKLFRITFLFFLLSLSSFAKDSTTVEFKRFVFGTHASPDYCYRILKVTAPNSATTAISENRNKNEIPMLGYTVGADLSYFIEERIAISLGVNYSRKGYINESIYLTDQNGIIIGNGSFKYNYNYVELPLKASVILGKKRVRFTCSVAVTSSFLLYEQTDSKFEYNDGTKVISKGKPNYIYNPFNLFLTESMGIDCKLGKKMGVKIEPTYSYGMLQTIDAPITEYLWSYGFNVGWHIDL